MIRSIPGSRQCLATRVHRQDRSVWLLLFSLSLHLAVLIGLLMKPLTPQPASVSEPTPVEFVMEKGPTEAALEAPTSAPAPAELPAPELAVAPAETPPIPALDATPPPVPQTEIPSSVQTSAPDVVSTAQQAEIPLPAIVPLSIPAPPAPPLPQLEPLLPTPPVPPQAVAPAHAPSPPRVVQTRPRRSPPTRTSARLVDAGVQTSSADAPARATEGQNAPGRANAGNNGAAWMGRLKQWWDQNSFYPKEASQTDEGGNVRVHIVIAGDGRVTSIDVVQSSGSTVLDSAATAVFRNAHLPPLPPGTPPLPADVVVTLHYRPSNNGR